MKATAKPEVAELCIDRARQILTGRLDLPAVHYSRDRSGIHLSGLQGCPAQPYYQKTLGIAIPTLSDHSVLNFTKGRAFERFFAEEQERVIIDDISCTADGLQPEHGFLEIKCTAEQMDFFDPITAHTDWIERIMGYCHAYGDDEDPIRHWNLVVFFIVGNMPNRLWWNIKDFGKSKEKYKGIDLRAWRLDFTEAEIGDNWLEVKRRRDMLLDCLKNETPPSARWIEEQTPDWKHKLCQMKDICYYHKEAVLGDNADSIMKDIVGQ